MEEGSAENQKVEANEVDLAAPIGEESGKAGEAQQSGPSEEMLTKEEVRVSSEMLPKTSVCSGFGMVECIPLDRAFLIGILCWRSGLSPSWYQGTL